MCASKENKLTFKCCQFSYKCRQRSVIEFCFEIKIQFRHFPFNLLQLNLFTIKTMNKIVTYNLTNIYCMNEIEKNEPNFRKDMVNQQTFSRRIIYCLTICSCSPQRKRTRMGHSKASNALLQKYTERILTFFSCQNSLCVLVVYPRFCERL